MALIAGTRLGPYEVLGLIGAGGMGEVYRAHDPRLGRDVAIKVLPADRLDDPARRARFLQEARAASALSHPNIVMIHEVEAEGDIDFLVMEYVAGRTLDTLIPRQGMRLNEALRIAIPLADALAAAHAAGIVHRDLKPANVMVTPDGTVKVLDFGLAKLLHPMASESGGTTTIEAHGGPLSGVGTVTGTVGYMSPEQATGTVVDARSDIFSFGALLYELVTGRRAFAGASSAETLAAILKEQPTPLREVVPDVPVELERILLRSLRKDPARRFQSISDVKVELQEIKEESDSQAAVAGAPVAHGTRRRWLPLAASGAILLAAATAATLWLLRAGEAAAPRVVYLSAMQRVLGVSFSPDGTQIVFSSAGDARDNLDIWLQLVGEDERRRLTTDQAADHDPAWSPDGRQIAFVRYAGDAGPGAVYLVSPLGGAERRLTDFGAVGRPSWSPDARWLAVGRAPGPNTLAGMGIWVVAVGSGEVHQVTFAKPSAWDVAPAFSPDGRALAYTSCEGGQGAETCNVWTRSLDTEVRPQGEPRRLTQQGGVFPAWTRDGRSIIYAGTQGVSRLWRVRADGSTPPERVELAGPGAAYPATVRCCDRLAYLQDRSDTEVYRVELGARATPLIASTFWDFNPQYSPDGRRITFGSNRADERFELWLADADGSNVTRLTRGPGSIQGTARWSPDGRRIAFDSQPEGGRQDIWTINVDGSGLRQVTRDPADECMPSWSRDGTFLYYGSNRTGRYEIWRIAVTGGPEEQVTQAGGFLPFESLDGRTLYYLRQRGGELLARPTAGGPERSIVSCIDTWGYAVGPQGVFHVDCATPGTPAGALRALRSWDAVTGKDREVAALDVGDGGILGLSASPDGRSLIYSRYTYAYDLMMIENFR